MGAKIHLKIRLPTRHGTGGPERAPHRSYGAAVGLAPSGSTHGALHLTAIAHQCGINLDPFYVAAVFKRTPYAADLKRRGRYVAKDLFEGEGVPRGFFHDDCPHGWKPKKPEFTSGAEQVWSARTGAVTHPGGAAEIRTHADL